MEQNEISKSPSKVQLAIDFMRANGGSATRIELREAMGLNNLQSPVQWLSSAIKDGRVTRTNDGFELGKGRPEKEEVEESSGEGGPETDCQGETDVVEQEERAVAFASWSDGDLAIYLNGESAAVLTADESASLAQFLRVNQVHKVYDPLPNIDVLAAAGLLVASIIGNVIGFLLVSHW